MLHESKITMLSKWLWVYHSREMIEVTPYKQFCKRNRRPARLHLLIIFHIDGFENAEECPLNFWELKVTSWNCLCFCLFVFFDHQSKPEAIQFHFSNSRGFSSMNYIQQLSILQLSIFLLITVIKQMKKLIGCFYGCKSSQWNAS